jgi:hypothetical protein
LLLRAAGYNGSAAPIGAVAEDSDPSAANPV